MPESYALRTPMLFDGFTMSGPATVHVDHGRIVAVDRTGAASLDKPVVELDPDVCLLPGLVDTHVHLAFDASPDPLASLSETDNEQLLVRMRAAARKSVLAGITTVRDLGDRDFLSLVLADDFRRNPESGPEILAAGPPITTPQGHCFFLGGEAEGRDELIAAVRERYDRGCQVVKVMASGGNMTPGSDPMKSQYDLADLRTVVGEAHRLGLPVAVHAHAEEAIADALAAGVDTIEHASFWGLEAAQLSPALLRDLAASTTYCSLTLGAAGSLDSFPPEAHAVAARLRGVMSSLVAAGVKIAVGSDAGILHLKPHDVLTYSVLDLVAFGISPLDALKKITSEAAAVCGVAGRKGRIQAGADADFLVVSGNPVADLDRLRAVRAVFRAGRRVTA